MEKLVLGLLAFQATFTVAFLGLRNGQYGSLLADLRKKGIFVDIFGVQKLFKLAAQPPRTPHAVWDFVFTVLYYISFAVLCATPAFLIITAWNLLHPADSALPFSFAIPHISWLTLAVFTVSCVIHEFGHFVAAKLLGGDVTGVGFGLRCFIPQFFIKVDNVNPRQRRRIASAGFVLNLLVAMLAIGASWATWGCIQSKERQGVTVQMDSNGFRAFDSIQEIAGQQIMNQKQYSSVVSNLEKQFHTAPYLFDDQAQVDLPIVSPQGQPATSTFGALQLPFAPFEFDPAGSHSVLTTRYVNGILTNIVQPVRLTINSQALLGKATQFCGSSSNDRLCILPAHQQNNTVRLYIPAVVNERVTMLETDFDELLALHVKSGYVEKKTLTRFNRLLELLILVAEVNLGIGILSILPLFSTNDGAEMTRADPSAPLSTKLAALGIRSIALVAAATCGVCAVYRIVKSLIKK